MHPTQINSMAHFLLLTMICTIFNSAAATNSTDLIKAEPRQDWTKRIYCYVCRSDKNVRCINEFDFQGSGVQKMLCGSEESERFNKELINSPIKHPLPHYDNSLDFGRTSASEDLHGCYTVISTDRLAVLRRCYSYPNTRSIQDNDCSSCKLDHAYAKCCTCHRSYCNTMRAGASLVSPPVLQKLLCMSLVMIMSGKPLLMISF